VSHIWSTVAADGPGHGDGPFGPFKYVSGTQRITFKTTGSETQQRARASLRVKLD